MPYSKAVLRDKQGGFNNTLNKGPGLCQWGGGVLVDS